MNNLRNLISPTRFFHFLAMWYSHLLLTCTRVGQRLQAGKKVEWWDKSRGKVKQWQVIVYKITLPGRQSSL